MIEFIAFMYVFLSVWVGIYAGTQERSMGFWGAAAFILTPGAAFVFLMLIGPNRPMTPQELVRLVEYWGTRAFINRIESEGGNVKQAIARLLLRADVSERTKEELRYEDK